MLLTASASFFCFAELLFRKSMVPGKGVSITNRANVTSESFTGAKPLSHRCFQSDRLSREMYDTWILCLNCRSRLISSSLWKVEVVDILPTFCGHLLYVKPGAPLMCFVNCCEKLSILLAVFLWVIWCESFMLSWQFCESFH